jgi:hypothetical protein
MTHPQSNSPVAPLTAAFERFHRANPHVYTTLLRLARQWRDSGKFTAGIELFYSRARWELSLAIEGDGLFQLANAHRAFYARALMICNPELDGMFRLCDAPEADAWAAQLAARLAQRGAA